MCFESYKKRRELQNLKGVAEMFNVNNLLLRGRFRGKFRGYFKYSVI